MIYFGESYHDTIDKDKILHKDEIFYKKEMRLAELAKL